MSRSRSHKPPPNAGGLKSKLDKSKRENAQLRRLTNRQRRNLKDLTAIILNAKKALGQGDVLRATALVSGNIKYPPSSAIDLDVCPQHGLHARFVKMCDVCKKEL